MKIVQYIIKRKGTLRFTLNTIVVAFLLATLYVAPPVTVRDIIEFYVVYVGAALCMERFVEIHHR